MKKRTKIILITVLALVALIFIFTTTNRIAPLAWGHGDVNQPVFGNEAINGYDAVAYHNEGKARVGADEHVYKWLGADWKFSSEENKNLFAENPQKYQPQYGGYCAFAVGKGFTANPDPESFEIIDGKLYLFAGEEVKTEWKVNQAENLANSEANW